jgi:hypothetical protein
MNESFRYKLSILEENLVKKKFEILRTMITKTRELILNTENPLDINK